MRISTFILASLLLPTLSASISHGLNVLSNVTNLFSSLEYASTNQPSRKHPKRLLMIYSIPLNVSTLPPPEPFFETYGDLAIVLSKYRRPIPIAFFLAMHVNCLWKIWDVVAHSQNVYQPPEVRPLDGPSFIYQHDMFQLELRQASSAVVNWEYVDLYCTLNLIVSFAAKYGMREMDVEVVVAGVGAFEGSIRYSGPWEALKWVE